MSLRGLAVVLAVLVPAAAARAAPAFDPFERTPNDKYPSDYSEHVYVLTFGPGDHPFFMFGHNAIWIRDTARAETDMDRVYNFGTFKFDSPRLILDFLG